MGKRILLIILVVLVIAQFFQPPHNNGVAEGPQDIAHAVNTPPEVLAVLKRSCYDCHSNHTDYPWYSKITPVNWWLNNHINEGKRHVNYSTFASYDAKRRNKNLDETAELVEKGEMPLGSYTWIHKDAVLSEAEKKLLIDWARGQEK